MISEALPGIWHTLVLSQIALVLTGMLALALYPLVSRHFFQRRGWHQNRTHSLNRLAPSRAIA